MIGIRSLRASSTARCSLLVSTIQTARRRAAHVADAAERLVELVLLALHLQQLLLGAAGAGHVVEVDLVELLEAVDPLVHGLEVGEHAAEPALVDVGHPDAGRLLGDRLLGLLLGADEHDRAALGDGVLDERVAAVDVGQRLLQVDDVDAVALGHDEALHLGVPATGLVPEVDAALEELAHGDDGHGGRSLSRDPVPRGRASCAPLVRTVASVVAGRRVSPALTPGASGPHRGWGLKDVARGGLPPSSVLRSCGSVRYRACEVQPACTGCHGDLRRDRRASPNRDDRLRRGPRTSPGPVVAARPQAGRAPRRAARCPAASGHAHRSPPTRPPHRSC